MSIQRAGLICGTMALLVAGQSMAQEEAIEARWNASLGVGAMKFEGDEELKDGFLLSGRLGYDFNEWWTFETTAIYAPELKENMRFDDATGQEVSRLEEAAGEGIHDVSAFGLAFDGLFHFTRWERLDPYLSLGAGLIRYSEKIGKNNNDLSVRAGGGVLYHLNDEWAIRGDLRTYIAGDNTEANAIIDTAVVWTWGARVPSDIVAGGGPVDSDGDRLTDVREGELNTDPYDQDTDDDGLTDGEEVLDTETNPLEPDTDWDQLTDGDEVLRHKTNPLERDTDRGGVSDGHEVIEDGTDLLLAADWDAGLQGSALATADAPPLVSLAAMTEAKAPPATGGEGEEPKAASAPADANTAPSQSLATDSGSGLARNMIVALLVILGAVGVLAVGIARRGKA